MSVTNMPVTEFVVVELVIMLSMMVAVLCVMRVGLSIFGMNECASVVLMKSLMCEFVSYLRRSMLKSPSKYISFLVVLSVFITASHLVLKLLIVCSCSLYMAPTMMFLEGCLLLRVISINSESASGARVTSICLYWMSDLR